MFRKRKSLVGLDIGTHSVKLVELTETGGHVNLTGFAKEMVAGEDGVKAAIAKAFKSAGIKTREVVTAVSGRSVIVRYVNMVTMSDEDLQSALRFEADKYIPFDIDEVMLSCQRIEEGETKQPADKGDKEMKVLLVAVKRTLIDEHVQLVSEMGLLPVVIDVDSFAAGNAFELRSLNSPRVENEERVVALIDIGAAKTTINIMRGTVSYFSREVYLAGNDFTEAVGRRLSLESKEAEKVKVGPENRTHEVEEAIVPVLDDLANEVHLSFDYYENQYDRQVEEIYISGGSTGLPGLEAAFERIFNRKVSFWDPTENLEISSERLSVDQLKAAGPQLAVAVGLASRILD
jgi:type IV pilus assembly protein PilM